jgi:hypothetical protein
MPRTRFVFRRIVGRWGRIRCLWGQRFCRPSRGWLCMGGRNPALTRWAIIWRPSGPGATALEGARLPRCIGIESGSCLWVFDTDPDPDTDAGGEVWLGGFLVRLGLGVHGGRNLALTRWAIICWPTGPGATDRDRAGGLVSCVWCPSWRASSLRTPRLVRSARMLQRLQGCFRFLREPGVRFATPHWLSAEIPPG